jgi:hypothetical protein
VKLQALTKLCAGYEASYRARHELRGIGPDQVRAQACVGGRAAERSWRPPPARAARARSAEALAPGTPLLYRCCRPRLATFFQSAAAGPAISPTPLPQLAQAKASEIDALLQRLSDVNDEMGGAIGGSSDARAHTLARHRDVLQEYTQVGPRRRRRRRGGGGAGGGGAGGLRQCGAGRRGAAAQRPHAFGRPRSRSSPLWGRGSAARLPGPRRPASRGSPNGPPPVPRARPAPPPPGIPAARLDAGRGARPRGAARGLGRGRAAAERAGALWGAERRGVGRGGAARRGRRGAAAGASLVALGARPGGPCAAGRDPGGSIDGPRGARPPRPSSSPPPQVHNASGALLRERTQLQTSAGYVDDMLAQAATVSRSLIEQRRVFDTVQVTWGAAGGGRRCCRGGCGPPAARGCWGAAAAAAARMGRAWARRAGARPSEPTSAPDCALPCRTSC